MAFNPLYKKIFNRALEEAGNEAFLQQVTKAYPYFSTAHFFLLKNTDPKSSDYPTIAAKTALHINNAFLLYTQLQKTTLEDGIDLPEMNQPTVTVASEAAAITEEQNLKTEVADTLMVTNLQVEEDYADLSLMEKAKEVEQTEIVNVDAVIAETSIVLNYDKEVQDEEWSPAVAEQSSNETAPQINIPKPIVETADSLVFEPLYTSDYFSSQGIKLLQEPLPTDKLGKQLKSFTEWLKTMKKVHDAPPLLNDQVDSSVQHLAEISNKDAEVMTETMAEVFLQQGKKNKAKEIYVKLSLLNPHKSAYFAAKLENLK
jgi:hypothetical protein